MLHGESVMTVGIPAMRSRAAERVREGQKVDRFAAVPVNLRTILEAMDVNALMPVFQAATVYLSGKAWQAHGGDGAVSMKLAIRFSRDGSCRHSPHLTPADRGGDGGEAVGYRLGENA